jgi:hypothetical protein
VTEQEDLVLRTVAVIERTTVAELRRRAVADLVARKLADPKVAEIVRLMAAARRARAGGGANVIEMRR